MHKILGWHWTDGEELRDGTPLVVGKTYRHEGELILCPLLSDLERGAGGYHACRLILNGLEYALGCTVSRVLCSGDIIEDRDKFVARERKVLWTVDATDILHEFACQCAEEALAMVDPPDPRSVGAIAVKRAWLRGEATDSDLADAWSAARSAMGAAVWNASLSAARAAALAAARDSARYSALAAVWDAELAAARDTRPAVWARQNRRLTEMVCAAHTGGRR